MSRGGMDGLREHSTLNGDRMSRANSVGTIARYSVPGAAACEATA